VVGGTSAGLAVLGEHVFSAQKGGVGPKEAMTNPRTPDLTMARDFLDLPVLKGTLTDTHFAERDRLGRLMAMMAGRLEAGSSAIRGIGVDEGVALVIDGKGKAQVLKEIDAPGGVHFVQMGKSDFTPLKPNQPLTATARVQHVLNDVPFSLGAPPAKALQVKVENGKMKPDSMTRYGWHVSDLED